MQNAATITVHITEKMRNQRRSAHNTRRRHICGGCCSSSEIRSRRVVGETFGGSVDGGTGEDVERSEDRSPEKELGLKGAYNVPVPLLLGEAHQGPIESVCDSPFPSTRTKEALGCFTRGLMFGGDVSDQSRRRSFAKRFTKRQKLEVATTAVLRRQRWTATMDQTIKRRSIIIAAQGMRRGHRWAIRGRGVNVH